MDDVTRSRAAHAPPPENRPGNRPENRPENREDPERAIWLIVAGVSGLLAVGFGAFGAHGLRHLAESDPGALAGFETGALYHLVHSGVLLALAAGRRPGAFRLASGLFVLGIILFSGSLYSLGLTGSRALVMVTPLGGLCFMAGWGATAFAGLRAARARDLSGDAIVTGGPVD